MKAFFTYGILVWLFGLICFESVSAQTPINKKGWLSTRGDTVYVDSFSLIPGTFRINEADSNAYQLFPFEGKLIWLKKPPVDSVWIEYQTFPFALHQRYAHKAPKIIESNFIIKPYYYNATEAENQRKQFIDFGKIDYAGSFGRVLSMGNNQDVVLNSQFNLQLDGELGDSIHVTGAITDNNIPFQPEGNTQQLQEFDRLFIQLRRKRLTLTAGDYDIKRPTAYFMNFYKRVQGAMVQTSHQTGKNGRNDIRVGVSYAKGKFVRNVLKPLEGNQGPYKLVGPNGETFFVVLAGTERVYIDGELMSRGESQDYVIDYNTAEITFMPRRLITKDWRIVVEFEFTDRNYLNSLLFVNDEWKINSRWAFRTSLYSNQDARNQPIIQTLNPDQKAFLAGLGDSIQKALYPSAQLDTFSPNKILYRRVDTLVGTSLYNSVYVFCADPDSLLYKVMFTQVGTGRGNYKQSLNASNGRVYAWVAPLNGIPQGDYEPVQFLVTPKRQQMMTMGLEYRNDSSRIWSAETAMSNSDPNTFSKRDDPAHLGLAFRSTWHESHVLHAKKQWFIQGGMSLEMVQSSFKSLERFRTIEFFRDWNTQLDDIPKTENIGGVYLRLEKKNKAFLEYRFDRYTREQDYRGQRHAWQIVYNPKNNRIQWQQSWMTQTGINDKSSFVRPQLDLEHQFKGKQAFKAGARFLMDHNVRKSLNDTLLPTAFSFDASTLYLQNAQDAARPIKLDYTLRRDRLAKNNAFNEATLGQTISLQTAQTTWRNQELRATASYRSMRVNDTALTKLKPEETVLGRLEYVAQLAQGGITLNSLYELGAGQEIKREFSYVQVPAGQGQYVWRDYNNDGLKQLNEFELANFPDEKLYIRVFTPTNQYVKAKYAIYNQSLSVNPRLFFKQTPNKWWQKGLSKLNLQSALQINNRYLSQTGWRQYNPFQTNFNDSLLIQSSNSLVNSLFINRNSNSWGIDIIQSNNAGRVLLNYGVDTRRQTEYQIRNRVNLNKKVSALLALKQGRRSFESNFLETRSYGILYRAIEPALSALFKNNQWRLQSSYRYEQRNNTLGIENETAQQQVWMNECKYNFVNAGSINAKLTFSKMAYNAAPQTSIGYIMLDGLLPGNNWLWSLQFDRRLSKNVEINFEYEGRRPAGNATIHTGRATVRAIF
ncbi:MAG: hypothetical protein ACR2IL_11595 [Chitinophagaceae bacterium]